MSPTAGGAIRTPRLTDKISTVLGQLAAGREAREILEDFPDLELRTFWLLWSTPPQRFRNVSCPWQLGDEVPPRLQPLASRCAATA